MKCRKCCKEFSDEFSFCPFCGAKKLKSNDAPSAPLFLSIPILSDEQLEQLSSEIHGKSGSIIRNYFESAVFPADVFVVRGEMKTTNRLGKGKGEWRLWELMKTTVWLGCDPDPNTRFRIEKKPYTKFMFHYIEKSVFRTEEEAQKAILKSGHTLFADGYWYCEGGDKQE